MSVVLYLTAYIICSYECDMYVCMHVYLHPRMEVESGDALVLVCTTIAQTGDAEHVKHGQAEGQGELLVSRGSGGPQHGGEAHLDLRKGRNQRNLVVGAGGTGVGLIEREVIGIGDQGDVRG